MNTLLQGVAAVIVGRGYLSSDHFSTATGLDPAITISKAGGNFANPAAGASVMTEIESTGWYKFSLGTGDTDTLGALIIRGTHAGMDNIEVVYQVVAAVTAANLTQVNGAAQTATLDTIKAETALIIADTGELQTNQGNWTTATGFATLASAIEGSITLQQALKAMLAFAAGKATGGGTTEVIFRSQADDKDRIKMTVDSDGNRSSTTLDLS